MLKSARCAYDVIIIGAGISGLVCGCYLAKAGMKVLIVEQHDKPGGYCSSFKRKGYTFDAAAHSFGSYREEGNFRMIVHDLGIDKIIKINRSDPSDMIITPDFKITFYNKTKKTISDLAKIFPHEKKNIVDFYHYFEKKSASGQFANIALKNKSFASFLSSFFTDTALISAISFPVFGNGGLPPTLMNALTGTKIFREFMMDGGYYPEGSMQDIPNALSQILNQHSGEIIYSSRVKRILCKNGSVTGILLENDQPVSSKYVVSACDVTQTFKTLLGEKIVDKQLIDKVDKMVSSISTFILYLGIDKPFKELPEPGTNIWYLPDYNLDKIFNNISCGSLDNFGGGSFLLRVSPNKKTILAFCATPFKSHLFWKQNKVNIAENILNRIENLVPSLKKHISYFDAATPSTLFNYTLNYQGANYGWAPLQSQFFDPVFRQKTFIGGLYLTGHWTCQAHGIPGVSYLGLNTAKLILKKKDF
jgi:phytoene dehydrogenase-like protein